MGVTMFFTLSGFLITSLLLEERERSGRVALKSFFARRAYRLLPALAVLVVVMYGASFVLGPELMQPGYVAAALLYFANWVRASGEWIGAVSHTWSLSIEEQFYLVWPLAMILAGRRWKLLGWIAVAGSVVALVLRVALWDGGEGLERVYFGTDTRADAILIGCVLAIWMHRRPVRGGRPHVATALIVGAAALSIIGDGFAYLWTPTIIALLTAAITWLVTSGEYKGWLENRALIWLGKRSYGLYLWHVPILTLLLESPRLGPIPFVVRVPLLIAISLLMTVLSWKFVEEPFLRMKERRRERTREKRPLTVG